MKRNPSKLNLGAVTRRSGMILGALALATQLTQAAYDPNWKKSQCNSYSAHGLWERYVFGGGLGWIDNDAWDSSSTEGVDCSSYVNRCWAITGYLGEHTSASHGYATSDYYPGNVPNTLAISQGSLQPWDIFVWHFSDGSGHTGLISSVGSSSVNTREAHCTACGIETQTRSKQSLTDNGSRYYRRKNWGAEAPPPPVTMSGTRIKGDFTGDGKDDVVMAYDYGNSTTKLFVLPSTGTAFGTATVWWSSTTFNSSKAQYIAGDFNGDGKADVAALYDYGDGTSKVFVMLSTGSAFGTANIWWASAPGNWDAQNAKMIVGDFNGDGKTDLAMAYDYDSSWTKIWTWISTGSGFTLSGVWYDSGAGNFNWKSANFLGGDFNGDGKADIAATYYYGSSTTKLWMLTSSGSGFSGLTLWRTETSWVPVEVQFHHLVVLLP